MRRAFVIGGLVAAFLGSLLAGLYLFPDSAVDVTAIGATESPLVFEIERDADVPVLPFDDNPDPSQCGIPTRWGDGDSTAWLYGVWEGDLIQPEVLVYDSHLRQSVTGGAPHGTEVQILLYQENPILDYYMVRIAGDPSTEGWVPEHFLSFEPVS